MTIDHNGQLVIDFTAAVTNLGRVPELTNLIIDMAHSGAWRDYETAAGHDSWREAELDYFLIACGVAYDDASRVLAWKADSAELVPLMDPDAAPSKRRSLQEVSAAWHAPVPPSLEERAKRLGWVRKDNGKLKAPPIPQRARVRAEHGVTMDEHARESRRQRIGQKRTRELDRIAKTILADVGNDDELRYLVDQLRQSVAKVGRPSGRPPAELAQWAADIERLGDDTKALSAHWGVGERAVQKRVKRVREERAA